ncbi:uncharacterized protein LOC132922295 [Rhopalosiphum padi]|uniref:uncharacterized protein LOC132922295 n=1 Tax=Rhopalosiphum padi TaxID=40932 RepID=UPI00298D62D4|nr:uncharacterized protein LOC132922295 [Rhopalosiphum padi]
MDKIRRLHADLSELLRIFSTGFGQMLLGFFVFNYINIVISFFYIIQFRYDLCGTDIIGIVKRITPYLLCTQNSFLIMSIIIAASRVNDTKRKMISYLRLIRISSLAVDTKLQVKMFMNQLTVFNMDEISAFGIFNINLNLVMAIIILLITGLTTLLQMKNDSNMIQYMNNTIFFYKNVSKPS